MICLYIDTSSQYLYTGIVKDDHLLVETHLELGQQLSQQALPEIIKNFEKVSLRPQDVDTIIVVNGPGSFTGIRIGITIAKTMAWTLHKKIIPISGLQAMALSSENAKYYVPLIDARRGYVFGAIYDQKMDAILEDQYISYQELVSQMEQLSDIKIITNDSFDTTMSVEKYHPNILRIVQFFEKSDGVNPHLINPNYLKRTEAEEKANI